MTAEDYRQMIDEALAPLGTDEHKPFLETAPWLIVVFEQRYGRDEHGEKVKYYYTKESVGLAAGFLIAALHDAGNGLFSYEEDAYNPHNMGVMISGWIESKKALEKDRKD